MARRKEAIEMLRERDEAPLVRPKGYEPRHIGTRKASHKT